ncbi:uncharacterized protein LOC5503466 isoform X2 [Nematostella vectensis]|uniref:uncharacterized protein LOC5503466 isoform X2 n=1 Tax=Nematostella vectensis TaxID=45351 RepID=UPI0020774EAC|nr:uncharacterized protein LOC5503466 isoform X2 [Nematostella vectensis]
MAEIRTLAEEREYLLKLIEEWNASRLDIFAISEPTEDLEYRGVMRFFFQDSGSKVATKCVRISSKDNTDDVTKILVDKFHPDMKMLTNPSYSLYEVHPNGEAHKLKATDHPLRIQLEWQLDDREGRFLLKSDQDKIVHAKNLFEGEQNQNLKRRLSKREKKQMKKKREEEAKKVKAGKDDTAIAQHLYDELPETSFTRSISNPEAVMRRRRQQKLEKKLKEFESRESAPGGTLKIFAETLKPEIPYKTLLVSVDEITTNIVKEALVKYNMEKEDPEEYCLVMVNIPPEGSNTSATLGKERVVHDEDCPLRIAVTWPENRGSVAFHLRRRANLPKYRRDKRRSKSPTRSPMQDVSPDKSVAERLAKSTYPQHLLPYLQELSPDGRELDHKPEIHRLQMNVTDVGSESLMSAGGSHLQLVAPHILPRHCVITNMDGRVSVTPSNGDAEVFVDGKRVYETTTLQHGDVVKFGRVHVFRFCDPAYEEKHKRHSAPGGDRGSASSLSDSEGHRGGRQSRPRSSGPALRSHHENHVEDSVDFDTSVHKDGMFETTFDVDGDVKTVSGPEFIDAHDLPYTYDRLPPSPSSPKSPNSVRDKLPATLEFRESGEDAFFAAVISEVNGLAVHFKLAPTYTLYMCSRYRMSSAYRPELMPQQKAERLGVTIMKIANMARSTIRENSHMPGSLAFWMANCSELLHFIKEDIDISPYTKDSQSVLAKSVQLAFRHLVLCIQHELRNSLPAFLDQSDDADVEDSDMEASINDSDTDHGGDGRSFHVHDRYGQDGRPLPNGDNLLGRRRSNRPTVSEVIYHLSSTMSLLRRCRVNAALTIQVFSQLFHFINMWLFNKLVLEPKLGLCSREWGRRISKRLRRVEDWALRQGLELAADCHLGRIEQAAYLLQAPKSSPADINAISSSCFKLNSVQMRTLLQSYRPTQDEYLSQEFIDRVVTIAEDTADQTAYKSGQEITLEEDPELQLPFLLPEDGYSCEVIRGVPQGLREFLEPLANTGLCKLTIQTVSSGLWTVYQSKYKMSDAVNGMNSGPEITEITFNKGRGGMGLSIVAAKGAGQDRLGIYIKQVVKDGPAAKDGRLQAGDQLIAVNGESLIGVSQEKAAECMVRSGANVTLRIVKQGAIYHGLATLLAGQQTPVPNREPRKLTPLEPDNDTVSPTLPDESLPRSPTRWLPSAREPTRQRSDEDLRRRSDSWHRRDDEERMRREEKDARRREEEERRLREEEDRLRREDELRRKREDDDRRMRDVKDRRIREEEERRREEAEEEERRREEEERLQYEARRREEEDKKRQLEFEREEEARQRMEEEQRLAMLDERKRREFEEDERLRKREEEIRLKMEEERRLIEEERRKLAEERRLLEEERRREDERRREEDRKRLEDLKRFEDEKRRAEEEKKSAELRIAEEVRRKAEQARRQEEEERRRAEEERMEEERRYIEEQRRREEQEEEEFYLQQQREREEILRREEERRLKTQRRIMEERQRAEEEIHHSELPQRKRKIRFEDEVEEEQNVKPVVPVKPAIPAKPAVPAKPSNAAPIVKARMETTFEEPVPVVQRTLTEEQKSSIDAIFAELERETAPQKPEPLEVKINNQEPVDEPPRSPIRVDSRNTPYGRAIVIKQSMLQQPRSPSSPNNTANKRDEFDYERMPRNQKGGDPQERGRKVSDGEDDFERWQRRQREIAEQREREERDREKRDNELRDREHELRERQEREVMERARQDRERQERENQERERKQSERQERERQERERQERERQERERQERERQEREIQEREHQERERQERERQERERQERERLDRERQEQERARQERERQERERKEREEREREEQLEKERNNRENAERARREFEEQQKVERERAERENAERIERDRLEREKGERAIRERLEQEYRERIEKEVKDKEMQARYMREKEEREREIERHRQALLEEEKQRLKDEEDKRNLQEYEVQRKQKLSPNPKSRETLDYIESMTSEEVELEFKRLLERDKRRRAYEEFTNERRASGLVSVTKVTYQPDIARSPAERDLRLQRLLAETERIERERDEMERRRRLSSDEEEKERAERHKQRMQGFQRLREEEEKRIADEHSKERTEKDRILKKKMEEQAILREKEEEARRQLQEEQRLRVSRGGEPDHVLELKQRALSDYERRRRLIDQEIDRRQEESRSLDRRQAREWEEAKARIERLQQSQMATQQQQRGNVVSVLRNGQDKKPKKQVSFSNVATEIREPTSPTYIVGSGEGVTAKITPAASVRLVNTRMPDESPEPIRPPPPLDDLDDLPPPPPPPPEDDSIHNHEDLPPPPPPKESRYTVMTSASTVTSRVSLSSTSSDSRSPMSPAGGGPGDAFVPPQTNGGVVVSGYSTFPRAARPASYPTPADLDDIQIPDSMKYGGSSNNVFRVSGPGFGKSQSLGRLGTSNDSQIEYNRGRLARISLTDEEKVRKPEPPPVAKKPESLAFKQKMKMFNNESTPDQKVKTSRWHREMVLNGEVSPP